MHRHWSSHISGRIGGVDLASWTGCKPTGSLLSNPNLPMDCGTWMLSNGPNGKYLVTAILLWKATISEDETSVTLTSENILPRAQQLGQVCTFGMSDHAIEAEMQQSCAHSLSTCSKLLACLSSNTKLVFFLEWAFEWKQSHRYFDWYVVLLMRFGHAQPLNFRY